MTGMRRSLFGGLAVEMLFGGVGLGLRLVDHAATEPVYMLNLMPTEDGTPALALLRMGR